MSIKEFNALPRKLRDATGLVPNYWYFDVRYIPLEPTPGHVFFLTQLDSLFTHSKRLPLRIPETSSGIAFFPEAAEEAAPQVCKALIHSFLGSFGKDTDRSTKPAPFAPWRLTTEDRSLAAAVAAEFRRMGVRHELCDVHVIYRGHPDTDIAQKGFDLVWMGFIARAGLSGLAALKFPAPNSISFDDIFEGSPWGGMVNDTEKNKILKYTQKLTGARPVGAVTEEIVKHVDVVTDLIRSRTAAQARAEADAGDAEAAIDYALRVFFALNCTQSRPLFRTYLIKSINSPNATARSKCTAHTLLLDWYTRPTWDQKLRFRYLHAATHHANQAAILSPGCSADALNFVGSTIKTLADAEPSLRLQYREVWAALERRKDAMQKERGKMEKKMAKRTNRYLCAAVNCVIQADTGRMLARCELVLVHAMRIKNPVTAAKNAVCNPFLISFTPQLTILVTVTQNDWKTHKPFCRPNAPCSILEKKEDIPLPTGPASAGSLSIPVLINGKTVMLSSSTLSPQTLKEVRDASVRRGPAGELKLRYLERPKELDGTSLHIVMNSEDGMFYEKNDVV
ncbi:hypothetical protein Hypma_007147 [Hypsizygus marmoreus]|uniref:Uncharacterized protein n=1 Tax=Hypsizygus marmoreus TaxID=39966 RepID=A0A369KD07_HYPMA|nr:hypothetical protein Hypma_007147 [Hypsizygus marmoreus]